MNTDDGDSSHDWRLVERRDRSRKQVSSTTAGWGEVRRSWWGSQSRDTATIADLSDGGLRLIGQRREGVTAGSEIEIEVGGVVGYAIVRYVRDDPFDADKRVYGLAVPEADEDLRRVIRARIEAEETTLEWVWRHAGSVPGDTAVE